MTFKEFEKEFEKYDTKKIYSKENILKLYDNLMLDYGFINEDNFNIFYAIENKGRIIF